MTRRRRGGLLDARWGDNLVADHKRGEGERSEPVGSGVERRRLPRDTTDELGELFAGGLGHVGQPSNSQSDEDRRVHEIRMGWIKAVIWW